jgi:hypothetical protein
MRRSARRVFDFRVFFGQRNGYKERRRTVWFAHLSPRSGPGVGPSSGGSLWLRSDTLPRRGQFSKICGPGASARQKRRSTLDPLALASPGLLASELGGMVGANSRLVRLGQELLSTHASQRQETPRHPARLEHSHTLQRTELPHSLGRKKKPQLAIHPGTRMKNFFIFPLNGIPQALANIMPC